MNKFHSDIIKLKYFSRLKQYTSYKQTSNRANELEKL